MSIKNDDWIWRVSQKFDMIKPFEREQVRTVLNHDGIEKKVISYGLSSYGYDIRCANEFMVFVPGPHNVVVDPKDFDERCLVPFKGDVCIIPPNSFALARSFEYFKIPRQVMTICLGKSTYARCGIIVNVTPFEPGVGGACHPRVLEYIAAAGQDLCE
jgi:dCTP deaminase